MSLTHYLSAAAFGVLACMIALLRRRQTEDHEKISQIWGFIYRRALVEALKQGFVTKNSPLRVRDDLAQTYCTIAPQLAQLYQQAKDRGLSEPDIALEIEKRHWPWIVEEICKPFDMDRGECLVIAVEVAKKHLEETS